MSLGSEQLTILNRVGILFLASLKKQAGVVSYLIVLLTLSGLIASYSNHFLGVVVAVAGIYFLLTYKSQKKSLRRLSLFANILGSNTEYPEFRFRWYDPALYSVPDYIEKKEMIIWRLLVLCGLEVIYEYQSVLGRKKLQAVQKDDYGYVVNKKWNKEKDYFIKQVILHEFMEHGGSFQTDLETSRAYAKLLSGASGIIDEWLLWIDSIADEWRDEEQPCFDSSMSGHDYERYLAELMTKLGWDAQVTPGSGDHGADIIATRGNRRLAIQCKLYSNAVGNKSVQEAYSAKGYYDCTDACVITNSVFTPAAKQAAGKLNITLLHHDDLEPYLAAMSS
ncbi:hypothetical protein C1896_07805 [Pseudomonadaceae bacterium SI-3]|nr:hypothetical protein C1896_07805 [Pseudomonadaceae bacterium SI-3]